MSLIRGLLLPGLLSCCIAGCGQIGYYAQAAKGQIDIIAKKQKIRSLIDHPKTPEALRGKLELVRHIRQFAVSELALPDNQSYRSYSETGRRFAVWNVVATPKYDLSLKTWCFPLAGCVACKGFFNKADAVNLKEKLLSQGFDTFLYGVHAYSTLGWFSDPVLDTFIDYSEKSLANLIFHELSHQVVYVKDDSGFNEAFATAVGNAGVVSWMQHRYSNQGLPPQLEEDQKNNRITEKVLGFRNQLANAYANGAESDLPKLKASIYEKMKQYYSDLQKKGEGTPYYDGWFSLDLNNAHLSSIAIYHRLVPTFEKILKQSGSYEDFYAVVKQHADLNKVQRDAWLNSFD